MFSLGITGGIGSGKSYICRLFAAKGIPVYDSDSRTKQLYNRDKELIIALSQFVGDDIIIQKGGEISLNKPLFTEKIFNNPSLMERVKETLYPIVMSNFRRWRGAQQRLMTMGKRQIPFVVFESAVILENPLVMRDLDMVITIEADVELRVKRIISRDGKEREEIMARMNSQWSDKQRREIADMVIVSGDDKHVHSQVEQIYRRLCSAEYEHYK